MLDLLENTFSSRLNIVGQVPAFEMPKIFELEQSPS